jgi:hypothetical protein
MKNLKRFLFALMIFAAFPLLSWGEHADIVLKVFRLDPDTGLTRDESIAYSDQEPPGGGVKARPLFKVKAKDSLVLQFILINTYPHGVNKDVTVRYCVVRREKVKQTDVPDFRGGMVTKGQFQLNFKPKTRVGARVAFTVPEPGIYLLRVDTLNTSSDHEHFSAIDLQVE